MMLIRAANPEALKKLRGLDRMRAIVTDCLWVGAVWERSIKMNNADFLVGVCLRFFDTNVGGPIDKQLVEYFTKLVAWDAVSGNDTTPIHQFNPQEFTGNEDHIIRTITGTKT